MSNYRLTMQDPRRQYDGPPFPRQPQPPPGLAARMTPRPDHGETSYRGNGRLVGRKALITGGDSGLGRAAAIAFAREGADIAFGYLPSEEEDAREVVELVEAEGRRALPLPGDLADETFCTEFVRRAATGLGGLDILVNNAGHQESRPSLAEVSSEEFDRTLKVNLYAPFWLTKTTVPLLPPGGGQNQSKVEHFGSRVPMGRPGQPVEFAPVYVFLASQEASYVTGEVYGVTGGTGII